MYNESIFPCYTTNEIIDKIINDTAEKDYKTYDEVRDACFKLEKIAQTFLGFHEICSSKLILLKKKYSLIIDENVNERYERMRKAIGGQAANFYISRL